MANNWMGGNAGGQPNFMGSKGFSGGAGIGSLLSGLMGLLGGHGPNPANEANKTIGQIPGQTKPYYQPYMDAGNKSLQELMGRYGQDAGDVYKHFGEGYQQSPGYKFEMDQALNAAKNSAASGGALGTPYSQQFAQESAQGVASKDYDKYMENVLGLYGKQNEGLGNINQMGYNANTGFAEMLANVLGQQGANTYKGVEGQNKANASDWEQIFQSIPWLGQLLFGNQQQGGK